MKPKLLPHRHIFHLDRFISPSATTSECIYPWPPLPNIVIALFLTSLSATSKRALTKTNVMERSNRPILTMAEFPRLTEARREVLERSRK